MEAVTLITERAVPLRRSDVDTDQIIPSDWLKRIERTGFGAGLFSEWREDPGFVLNQEQYRGAGILVAGPNFGTGSSREHAPWALEDYGFRAIISSRFADIFRNNSTKTGLLTVTVPQSVIEQVWEAIERDPSIEIVIDVEQHVHERQYAGRCAGGHPLHRHRAADLLQLRWSERMELPGWRRGHGHLFERHYAGPQRAGGRAGHPDQ